MNLRLGSSSLLLSLLFRLCPRPSLLCYPSCLSCSVLSAAVSLCPALLLLSASLCSSAKAGGMRLPAPYKGHASKDDDSAATPQTDVEKGQQTRRGAHTEGRPREAEQQAPERRAANVGRQRAGR